MADDWRNRKNFGKYVINKITYSRSDAQLTREVVKPLLKSLKFYQQYICLPPYVGKGVAMVLSGAVFDIRYACANCQ